MEKKLNITSLEKALMEAKTLDNVKDLVKKENSISIGVALVLRDPLPLYTLVNLYPHLTKAIEFYRDRTSSADVRDSFNHVLKRKDEKLFSLLLTEKTAGEALIEVIRGQHWDIRESSGPKGDKLKQCFAFPQTQESLNTALSTVLITIYDLNLVKLLREKGAKFKRDIQLSSVIYALTPGTKEPNAVSNLIKTILEAPEAKEIAPEVLDGALMTAVNKRHIPTIESLLKLGANPSHALDQSCYYDDSSFLKLLLANGADPNINNGSPLYTAVCHNKERNVELLLEYKVNIHADRDRAFKKAASLGNYAIVDMLLKAGAKVSVGGQDPIRWAARGGHSEVVKLLLENGANPRVKNNQALEWAKGRNHTEVVTILEEWLKEEENEEN